VFIISPPGQFQEEIALEHFVFETLPSACNGGTSFAYAYGVGGGSRRQSVLIFSIAKRSRMYVCQ